MLSARFFVILPFSRKMLAEASRIGTISQLGFWKILPKKVEEAHMTLTKGRISTVNYQRAWKFYLFDRMIKQESMVPIPRIPT